MGRGSGLVSFVDEEKKGFKLHGPGYVPSTSSDTPSFL